MPGAYTHLYVADVIVDRLKAGQLQGDGTFELSLAPIDNSDQPYKISFDGKLADVIQRNSSSFRAGAVSPDFFPDVFTGIVISHQPYRRSSSWCKDFSTLPYLFRCRRYPLSSQCWRYST